MRLLLFAAIAAPAIAHAQVDTTRWSLVGRNQDSAAIWIDTSRVVSLYDHTMRRVWLRMEPGRIDTTFTYSLLETEFRCAERQYRPVQIMIYRRGKTLPETERVYEPFSSAPPESLLETTVDNVCALKLKR